MKVAAEETAAMWPAEYIAQWLEDIKRFDEDPESDNNPYEEPEDSKWLLSDFK